MCGICGIVHRDGHSADLQLVARMLAQLPHRGPDDRGIYADGPACLGHCRLSIIDLSGGRQPMSNEDGSLWVTFNGEIFNYVELRELLVGKGHRFATRSDTEVILHLYEEYGADCVRHFNGQWALAVWDSKRQTLLLSRDRLGVRPLYYTTVAGALLFASEVKALLAHPHVSRQIDPRGLDQLFTFWAPLPPTTVFQDIRELPPGHNLLLHQGQARMMPYWQLDYGQVDARRSEADCAEQLLELLSDATRLRLRADVPVAAYLSGGLDSTVTAALAKQCVGARLRTFSVTFDDAEFDESGYQRQAVAHLHTDHQSVGCRLDDIAKVFPEVIWHAERPVLRTAPAPMWLLSQLVRQQGFKVVLTGEGADETLGGYDIFKEAKVRRFWAAQPQSPFRAQLLRRLYPYLPRLQAQPLAYREAFFRVRPEDLASPFFSHLPRWELTARLKVFFSQQLRASLAGQDAFADCLATLPAAYGGWQPLCQAQYLESTMLLPGYILSSQGDRMAMANSIEGRFPFLDHRVVEFAATLPTRMKMKGLDEKHLLKRAVASLVPRAVLRRSKQPYRAPDAKCFLAALASPDRSRPAALAYVAELLSPERIADDGVFQPAAVAHLLRKLGHHGSSGIKDDMALVGILSTQLLLDKFVRNYSPRPVTREPIRPVNAAALATPDGGWPADPNMALRACESL